MIEGGWARRDLGIVPRGLAMHGYGEWKHRADSQRTPLHVRAIVLRDAGGRRLLFACLDLGYVTQAMRAGVVAALRASLGADFDEAAFVLTCTHTHSGPGGCAHEAMYNFVTPGFVPEHLARVVSATHEALLAACAALAPVTLSLVEGRFDEAVPVAWNRALGAYNRNAGVARRGEHEAHRALDRRMQVLAIRREGRVQALLSLFGVHATCLGTGLRAHDGDNKGYAAAQAEAALAAAGAREPVAIFAQGTAGDVSPHYHGPGQMARRRALSGEAEIAYARRNGALQAELAQALVAEANGPAGTLIDGPIDALLSYADFSEQHAEPEFADGEPDAWTSEPCHGVAFYLGTPVDGAGIPKALGLGAIALAAALKRQRLANRHRLPQAERQRLERLYAAQGNKAILVQCGSKQVLGQPFGETFVPGWADPVVGEMKRQWRAGALADSPLLATVLPLQIVRIGPLALVCAPGEFTTIAGQRLRETVAARLAGSGVEQVLLCTYCNDYMGYVTTREEYAAQTYEGGHTVFGQWTLAAFQTRYAALATQFAGPDAERDHDRTTRPMPVPAQELALRTARG